MTLELERNGSRAKEIGVDFATAIVEATPELRRIAGYYVGNPDSAEDVVQATLLTAIERAESYDRARPLVPWLAGILLNKVAALRRERRARELEPDRLLGPSSESIAASNEIERLVEEGLAQLPPKYRVVLELYLRDGEQGAEIAARLRKPPGTVRAQIHRGLGRLRALLPGSLALGTLFAFLLGRFRASASPSGPGGGPQAIPRKGWLRANPGLSLAAGVLVLATGGIALSASLDRGRVAGVSAPTSGAVDVADLGAASARERRSIDPLEQGALALSPADAPGASVATLALHVFDRRSRAPLAGAELAASAETRDGERLELRTSTDDAGNARLELAPATVERLTVRASAPGHAPHWSAWNATTTTFDGRAALRIPLHGARRIGGTLVDEAGRGIADALVHASIPMLVDDELWSAAPEELVTRTDDEGRWSLADAPDDAGQIHLRLAHPEYVSELAIDDRRRPPPEELWAGTSRVELARGRPIALRVLDPRGSPVADAVVRLLEHRDPPQITIQLATDDQGRVEFAAPDEDAYIVQVRAPGYVPSALFLGRDARPESEVRLRIGTPVTVQILDADGLPAADARVRRFGSTWDESIGTDAEGFLRLEVPEEKAAWISVRRSGIWGASGARVGTTTREIRLPREVRVSGQALDASSGLPIERSILRLLTPDGTEVARLQHAGGTDFEFAFYPQRSTAPGSAPATSFALEVSAPGFVTELTEALPTVEELRIEPRLSPTAALDLLLVDGSGSPADYAGLAVCRAGAEGSLTSGLLIAPEGQRKVFARGDGRLRLNRPEGSFALAVVGQAGFAYVRDGELGPDGRIEMRRWGRVEGRGEPGTEIRLEPLGDYPGLAFDYGTRVDERGRYQFRGVPAGLARVHPASDPARAVVVHVVSGETAEATLP
jgi:RNA polymerase sigma-70 factor (ECF subfamily)